MTNRELYIILVFIFIEFTMRSFFETNFLTDEHYHRFNGKYRLFRLAALGGYLGFLFLLGQNFFPALFIWALITVVDVAYMEAERRYGSRYPIKTFLGMTWFAAMVCIALQTAPFIQVGQWQLRQILLPVYTHLQQLITGLTYRRLVVFPAVYLLCIHPSNRVVGWVLSDLRFDREKRCSGGAVIFAKGVDRSLRKAGRYIGSLERIFIVTFLQMRDVTTIGLMFTAKTIARFDMARDQAEYYLVGTLTSILSALVIHAFLKIMLG